MKNQESKKGLNVYQMVTDKVIEQMNKGIIPWHRPWNGVADGAINYVTRKPYSLLNQMLLGRDGEWLTWKQVQQQGGKIKKGAKAGIVVFYGKYVYTKEEKQDGEEVTIMQEHTIPVLKYYHVFHIEDCTGIESKLAGEQPGNTVEPAEQAEAIINAYVEREKPLKFQNDKPSNRAFYRPSDDLVVVPMLSQYTEAEEYYSTTFHELTHSTMTEWRCNRKAENKMAAFGSADYSREELVAELGAAMLCTVTNIDNRKAFRNSVAYIQGWLRALKNDNKMIVWAASRAEKAARYIIGEK
jgi:antirestriction protein ArdC